MDISELPAAKGRLEEKLYAAITEALAAFKAETGVSVSSINAEFVDASGIEDQFPRLALSHVSVELGMPR